MSFTDAEGKRALLRHTVATLAYRGGKAIRGAPEGFADLRFAETSRTPGEILAHIGDLLDWGLTIANGKQVWRNSPPLPWPEGEARFYRALAALDARLASAEELAAPAENIFQGPVADALTHVGQIAMLRRMGGSPVRGENYFKAEIVSGRVGPEQSGPQMEFD
jgi:hypothetical protein